jgi:hypothetical protein
LRAKPRPLTNKRTSGQILARQGVIFCQCSPY